MPDPRPRRPRTGSSIDEQIRELNATLTEGPASTLVPFDVEEVVSRWRHSRKSDPPCDSSS